LSKVSLGLAGLLSHPFSPLFPFIPFLFHYLYFFLSDFIHPSPLFFNDLFITLFAPSLIFLPYFFAFSVSAVYYSFLLIFLCLSFLILPYASFLCSYLLCAYLFFSCLGNTTVHTILVPFIMQLFRSTQVLILCSQGSLYSRVRQGLICTTFSHSDP
jgi:hypothetical protein